MLTTRRAATLSTPAPSLLSRTRAIVRAPFTHVYAAPLWLAVRLYLGYMWLMMGLQKIEVGFLSSDPIGPILQLGADGTLAVPLELWRPIAGLLVASGLTPLVSWSMPFMEIAIALAFVSGVLVVPAALGATLLNVIFVLSGIGQIQLDGRFIALQLLMLAAFRIVGMIGVEKLIFRGLITGYRKLRTGRASTATTQV